MDEKKLPEEYLNRMKRMLGEEFEAFLDSCSKESVRSLRCNILKKGEDIKNFF